MNPKKDEYMRGYGDGFKDAIPEGWVLVPKEPTQGMLAAGNDAYCRKADDAVGPAPTEHPAEGGGAVGYCYRAMLAASKATS